MKTEANCIKPPIPDPNACKAFSPCSPAALFRRRVGFSLPEDTVSKTKQEFKDDCDINRILSKYQRTGALSHFATYAGSYGDFSACDYQTAQNTLIRARQMFDALPSSVRNLVSTPAGFLDFVQNPANQEKMRELGLMPSKPVPVPPATPAAGSQTA